ncbi:hypothetical protein NIES2109_65100 (plasmid) [Nostoc sp. HK-01]|nr:hypothetical protein NIES2109_65100 [Nostoc sp. HK-01]
MTAFKKLIKANLRLNIVISQSPDVLEQVASLPSESQMAYQKEVVKILLQGEFPGRLVKSSFVSNKELFYISLSTGELVYYEVTPPYMSSTPNDSFTYCSIHFIVPKHLVDEFERKTILSSIRKNIDAFTAPVRQFLIANKVVFFICGGIFALIEYFF